MTDVAIISIENSQKGFIMKRLKQTCTLFIIFCFPVACWAAGAWVQPFV